MLTQLLSKYQIVLGSNSPRRKELLTEMNIPFVVRTQDCPELYPHHLQKEEITNFLAEYKSNAITISDQELIITADTIVWCDDQALEKPNSKKEAFKMLSMLAGYEHEVITSVCIATTAKTVVFHDTTMVYFDKLTDDDINYYIDTFQPFDKAGSYGIQEWIGHIGIPKINGSFTNVMGLPTQKLYIALKKF